LGCRAQQMEKILATLTRAVCDENTPARSVGKRTGPVRGLGGYDLPEGVHPFSDGLGSVEDAVRTLVNASL